MLTLLIIKMQMLQQKIFAVRNQMTFNWSKCFHMSKLLRRHFSCHFLSYSC